MTDRAPELEQHLVHGLVALGVERDALLLRLQDLLVLGRLDGLLDLVAQLGEPRESGAGQAAAAAEVAAGDQVRVRVGGRASPRPDRISLSTSSGPCQ